MEDKVYLNAKKTQCVDYCQLKTIHKMIMNAVIDRFKEEAFGENHQECLNKIENEITEKYKALKSKLLKHYENQLKAILIPHSSSLE